MLPRGAQAAGPSLRPAAGGNSSKEANARCAATARRLDHRATQAVIAAGHWISAEPAASGGAEDDKAASSGTAEFGVSAVTPACAWQQLCLRWWASPRRAGGHDGGVKGELRPVPQAQAIGDHLNVPFIPLEVNVGQPDIAGDPGDASANAREACVDSTPEIALAARRSPRPSSCPWRASSCMRKRQGHAQAPQQEDTVTSSRVGGTVIARAAKSPASESNSARHEKVRLERMLIACSGSESQPAFERPGPTAAARLLRVATPPYPPPPPPSLRKRACARLAMMPRIGIPRARAHSDQRTLLGRGLQEPAR